MCITNNGYKVLKSIDLTNFVNVLMCSLVSCSEGARCHLCGLWLLSFSSCVQFRIMWPWGSSQGYLLRRCAEQGLQPCYLHVPIAWELGSLIEPDSPRTLRACPEIAHLY